MRLLKKANIDKPIINISTCPVHTDHLVGTILYVLVTGKIPELDSKGRPAMYFGDKWLIHDNCRRRAHFDAGEFLKDWNDPKQKNWCLFEKGCKGPHVVHRLHGTQMEQRHKLLSRLRRGMPGMR